MFSKDIKMGKENEDKVFNLISKYWADRQISKALNQYSNYDFFDSKYTYELKSRRVQSNHYPTTMIPSMKCHKRTYLLFLFTDGLFYIRYNKNKFKEFDKKLFVRNREDKIDVEKYYYYIPIDKLKKINLDLPTINDDSYKVFFN